MNCNAISSLESGAKELHFIGIGGVGMAPLARVFHSLSYAISGSDMKESLSLKELEMLGMTITIGHASNNVPEGATVVISSAIKETNPELLIARERGQTIIKRGALLAALANGNESIIIGGSHGKTTTTAMVSEIFKKNFAPTVLLGGTLQSSDDSYLGTNELIIAEGDESDGSFLLCEPSYSIVTNIDNDHLDYYGSMADLEEAFMSFAMKTKEKSVLCIDNSLVETLSRKLKKQCLTVGLHEKATLRAVEITYSEEGSRFTVLHEGHALGKMALSLPGQHNIQNALCAMGVALLKGIDFDDICHSLQKFCGVNRRFQVLHKKDFVIVDDYGHHPTEIKTTLKAIRNFHSGRVFAIFEPHRFSRSLQLRDQFGQAFCDADVILVTDIYGAGEKPAYRIYGEDMADSIKRFTQKEVYYLQNKRQMIPFVKEFLEHGDYCIFFGAGNLSDIAKEIVGQISVTHS